MFFFFFLVPSAIWLDYVGENAEISTVSQVPKTRQITPYQSRLIIILGWTVPLTDENIKLFMV